MFSMNSSTIAEYAEFVAAKLLKHSAAVLEMAQMFGATSDGHRAIISAELSRAVKQLRGY